MRSLRCPWLTAAFWLVSQAMPASAAAQEDAQPTTQPGLRLHVEGALGLLLSDSSRWPDGLRASPSCPPLSDEVCDFAPALALGMDWSLSHHFDLGLRGRWIHPFPVRTMLGRHLDVVEVLIVPQLNVPWKWRRWPPKGARPYVAAPVGVAWSFQYRNWTRAVSEDWNSRPGLSAGVAVGFEMYFSRRFAILVELGYQARFLSADVVSTPVDEPEAQVSERVTTTQHQILFSVGVLFGLHR